MKTYSIIIGLIIVSVCNAQSGGPALIRIVNRSFNKDFHDTSIGRRIFLNVGKVWTPKQYSNKRTGTKDSDMGELKSDNLLINYDIGFAAGTHIDLNKKGEYNSYYDTLVEGHKVAVGIKDNTTGKQLIVTIWDKQESNPFTFPANFWAIIKDEKDIKEVLTIAFSYKPTR